MPRMLQALILAALLPACTCMLASCAAPIQQQGDTQVAREGSEQPVVPPRDERAQPSRPLTGTQLDKSCSIDADCSVKNVGNCCGYYPACVNKDAVVDPEAVQDACARSGMAGVCGFKEIGECSCAQGQCADVASGMGRRQ